MSPAAQKGFRVGASLTSTPTRALRALVCVSVSAARQMARRHRWGARKKQEQNGHETPLGSKYRHLRMTT